MTSRPEIFALGWLARGTIAFSKPSFAASLSRSWPRGAGRTSPASPISPNTTTFSGIARSESEDTTARLTARSAAGSPMRTPPTALTNTSCSQVAMPAAVLHRHAGIATWEQDVFVNAVGGVRIGEPAADLAVSLAVVSSLSDRAIPEKVVVFGEIGLAGEVRPAPRGQDRLKEAAKLGFEKAIVPRANQPKAKISGLEVMAVERVDQAVALLRNL